MTVAPESPITGAEVELVASRRAVLLVGSARPRGQSTSEALGRALLLRLEAHGFESQVFWVARTRDQEHLASLAAAIDAADVFVLASPLYVDSLPHLVTAALEHIARGRQLGTPPPCRFLALVNCGFPEAAHTRVALDICRLFAAAARLECAGTLGLGGGEAIGGRPPDRMGWFTRHVTRALDMAADALAGGRTVPAKAAELMGRPLVPARGYTLIGDMGWRRAARRNRTEHIMDDQPYPPAAPRSDAYAGPPPLQP